MLIIPALGRLRQEDLEFKTGLGYSKTLSQKKKFHLPNFLLRLFPYSSGITPSLLHAREVRYH
jgi:hypothetical protein